MAPVDEMTNPSTHHRPTIGRTCRAVFLPAICLAILSACPARTGETSGGGLTMIRNGREIPIVGGDRCLRVLTYNIRLGAGKGRPFTPVRYLSSKPETLRAVAEAIGSVNPDMVALQEVKGSEQASALAGLLRMNYAYAPHGRKEMDWGLALLSKTRIAGVETALIYPGRDRRVGALFTLDLEDARIQCINLHYHLGGYRRQVAATLRLVKRGTHPLILAGDLNFSAQEQTLGPLLERLADSCALAPAAQCRKIKRKGTVGGLLRYRIDYVFVQPRLFAVEEVGLLPLAHRHASDHVGSYACVRLKPPPFTPVPPQTEMRPRQKAPGP